MATLASTLRKKKARRKSSAPTQATEEKKQRKPAYLKRKMAVSQPSDPEEKEADKVAKEVSRAAKSGGEEEAKEDKKMISSKPVPSARRLMRRVNRAAAQQNEEKPQETAAKRLRRSVETEDQEEQPVQRLFRKGKEETEQVARRLSRAAQAQEPERESKPAAAAKLRRSAEQAGEEQQQVKAQARLFRAEAEAEEQQAAETGEGGQDGVEQEIEQRIENTRGKGDPLPEAVRKDMEQQFGQDFSAVVIHNDAEAAELCKNLNARAFTVGDDIYFAPGEFAPETEGGRDLLAHELTHTLQQGMQVSRKIFTAKNKAVSNPSAAAANAKKTPEERAKDKGATLDSDGKLSHKTLGDMDRTNHKITLPNLNVPAVKKPFTAPQPLVIKSGKERGKRDDQQTKTWDGAVQEGSLDTALTAKLAKAPKMSLKSGGEPAYYLKLKREKQFVMGTKAEIIGQSKRPRWNKEGVFRTYDVDHKKEYQLGGEDAIDNFWLLESSANRSSGSKINTEFNQKIEELLELGRFVWSPSTVRSSPENARSGDEITITTIGGTLPISGTPKDHYTLEEINSGAHLSGLDVLSEREIKTYNLQGSPTRIVIFSNPNGGQRVNIPWSEGQKQVELAADPGWGFSGPDSNAGIRFKQLNYQQEPGSSEGGTGTVTGIAYSKNKYLLGQPFTWNIVPMPGVAYGGVIDPGSVQGWVRNSLKAKGFSPIEVTDAHLESGVGLVAGGQIHCDLPLLKGTQLALVINGSDVELDASIPIDQISLPKPITVTHSALHIFVGSRGFGADGVIGVDIANLGSGEIKAGMTNEQAFYAEGKFNFDPGLFDRTEINVWYKDNEFGGSGTIGIDQPDKIKGIRSANVTASYEKGAFSASGDVQPNIPGVQQAGLTVAYSEQTGLTIGGNLELTANPAIRSGSIAVKVNKKGDVWKVSATGSAQPAIPGVDSQLTVSYDDGAFTAEFSGAYQRGMLTAQVTVGASNRAVGEDGKPSGEPLPDGALNVYGSGSATIKIAPWLQGKAGIRFDPTGEVTVSGEIGIPNNVEIFARKELEKSLFSASVKVPIVPGIVAEVGGGLSAKAGIGPGVIDQLRLGIEYNPAHEENTHVTGDAHLKVPADAGLRLSARAGIGVGITGVSVTGGLEIGGTLGIEGAAEAGVHIDWTPATGLDLTANLSIHAQPSFTFDVSGYVEVEALFFTVYENRWQLASYQFGSGYQFGISLPIHYHEGQPFDISLDDVQFQVPDISPSDIVYGLIERIV